MSKKKSQKSQKTQKILKNQILQKSKKNSKYFKNSYFFIISQKISRNSLHFTKKKIQKYPKKILEDSKNKISNRVYRLASCVSYNPKDIKVW